MALSILYVGAPDGTCRHRAEALARLGHHVTTVAAGYVYGGWRGLAFRVGLHLRRPPDTLGVNRRILAELTRSHQDLLWVDKGIYVKPHMLTEARRLRPGIKIVAYSPDDMFNPANHTVRYRRGIPLYDLHVTTKSFNVEELQAAGATSVMMVDNAYDPVAHSPAPLEGEELDAWKSDVAFIGMYESTRADTLWELAEAGVPVTVYGGQWDRYPRRHANLRMTHRFLRGRNYARAIGAARINLGFLRKVNRDLQTTRSIEIPACGGFLLAERTDEHRRLFEEGVEAEFFEGMEELIEKCRYYLEHETERARIAEAGRRRCVTSGYSNDERLATVLERLR